MKNNQDVEMKDEGENKALKSIEYKEKGNELLKNDRVEEAVEYYTMSLNLHPDNPKVLCNRAMAYKKLGKF